MTFLSTCCNRSHARRHAPWIIGVSLATVATSVLGQIVFGESHYFQALLYSAFPLALVASEQWDQRAHEPLLSRVALVVLSLACAYAFFLGVTVVADSIGRG